MVDGQSRFSREEVDEWMVKKGRKAGGERVSAMDMLKGDLDPLSKRIVFAAILTAELEKEGFSPVAAGNYAVELYTSGAYKAQSVDVIAPDDLLNKVLAGLGFTKEDGAWANTEVDIAVTAVAADVDEAQLQRVNQIDISGFPVYLLGLEDVIVGKLADFVKRGESNAITWAGELIEAHVGELDQGYLRERAEQESVAAPLEELLYELGLHEGEEDEKFRAKY